MKDNYKINIWLDSEVFKEKEMLNFLQMRRLHYCDFLVNYCKSYRVLKILSSFSDYSESDEQMCDNLKVSKRKSFVYLYAAA